MLHSSSAKISSGYQCWLGTNNPGYTQLYNIGQQWWHNGRTPNLKARDQGFKSCCWQGEKERSKKSFIMVKQTKIFFLVFRCQIMEFLWFTREYLKGKYHCTIEVWLVWNQLYHKWQFLFLFAKQTNPNQSNRRSTVHWHFPLKYSLYLLWR